MPSLEALMKELDCLEDDIIKLRERLGSIQLTATSLNTAMASEEGDCFATRNLQFWVNSMHDNTLSYMALLDNCTRRVRAKLVSKLHATHEVIAPEDMA